MRENTAFITQSQLVHTYITTNGIHTTEKEEKHELSESPNAAKAAAVSRCGE